MIFLREQGRRERGAQEDRGELGEKGENMI